MTELSREIPTAPGARPLIGHLVPFLKQPFTFLAQLPEHGDLVKIRLGPKVAVVICDPGLARKVLVDDRTFDKGGLFLEREREWLGESVATCTHSTHRHKRRLAQPAFHPKRLADYAHTMTSQIASVVDGWRSGQVLDVCPEMFTITSRVFGAAMFSSTLPAGVLHQVISDLTTTFDGTFQRTLLPDAISRVPIPGTRRYNHANRRLRTTMNDIIAERRASGIDNGDLLSALLTVHDRESDARGTIDDDVSDAVVTFFVAGTETTSSALAWVLYLLAKHPEVEAQLHAEIDSVLAGRQPDYSDMERLRVATRIVTETLRLYPPAWFFTRIVTAGVRLEPYELPVGSTVALSPYLIHRRADLYDRPDRFDPDRWLPERAAASPGAFLPFGGGARKCIGEAFGMTEVVLALVTIASRWRLQTVAGSRVRPPLSVSLVPGGLHLRVLDRRAGR
ncbi:pentalenene oxygenase [Nocardia amikacinitolerans]|uniref:cytochrome P450 n=1 Tax=Nocardia amikacinitolerans TaxID=756689 RepID=UPI00082FEA82|nr:cytochrome P450 [Nocardia amikacinitolerans]MCP2317992.1 pentalenene oxygenase [Nocardia amikacinitolerans]